jgi:hypothetical protein
MTPVGITEIENKLLDVKSNLEARLYYDEKDKLNLERLSALKRAIGQIKSALTNIQTYANLTNLGL